MVLTLIKCKCCKNVNTFIHLNLNRLPEHSGRFLEKKNGNYADDIKIIFHITES